MKKAGPGMFTLAFRLAGETKQVLVVRATCSWCRYPDTQCAAVLRPAGAYHSPEGSRRLYAIVRSLCNHCFREYWAAGGREREAGLTAAAHGGSP